MLSFHSICVFSANRRRRKKIVQKTAELVLHTKSQRENETFVGRKRVEQNQFHFHGNRVLNFQLNASTIDSVIARQTHNRAIRVCGKATEGRRRNPEVQEK